MRIPRRYAVLSSLKDRRGLLFSGDNLRYIRTHERTDLTSCYLYGNDVWLTEGEEYTETITLQLLPGIAGMSMEREHCVAGIGGLLDRRYVTSEDTAHAYFTHPDKAFRSEVSVLKDGKALLSVSGAEDVALDLSGLQDGAYSVLKKVTAAGNTLECEEPVTILKSTYAEIDEAVSLIKAFVDEFRVETYPDPDIARIRLGVIDFKLSDIAAYKRLHEVEQVKGLLKDAQRAVESLKNHEPALLPDKGKLIYSNDFENETDDFNFFGAGDIKFSPEHGLYFQGIGTMNMWSKFPVNGSFMVEFDYCPLESPKGGTMLQICGTHPNPASQYSFMCSASWGSMIYYKFGMSYYHFSFDVRGRACRLRKGGKGFYVLTHVPDPVPEKNRWYHLQFVKQGNHLMFFTNGKLVQEYFDEGHQGPILDGGHIGLRNWSTHRSYLKNFRVYRVPQDT